MTEEHRTPLSYATPSLSKRGTLPIAVSIAMIAGGTILVAVPWLALFGTAGTIAYREMPKFPLTWISIGIGAAMVWIGYGQARR